MTATPPVVAQERRLPWFVPAGLALLVGLFLRDLIDQGTDAPAQVIAAVEPQPTEDKGPEQTSAAALAELVEPDTPTPFPTAKPTNAPTVDMRLNDCGRGTVRPGDICMQPPAPTPTEAPFPNCPTEPGHWCVVPVRDETTSRQESE